MRALLRRLWAWLTDGDVGDPTEVDFGDADTPRQPH